MTSAVNSNLEIARREFVEWATTEGNKIGEGNYEKVAANVMQAAEGLQTADMTLHNHNFRWGFNFSYGEIPGKHKFVPISLEDDSILQWLDKKEVGDFRLPIKDPQTDTYFLPKVTVNEIKPPSGSCPTWGYLGTVVFREMKYGKMDREYRMLEALTPYADLMKKHCGSDVYGFIASRFPGFPPRDEQV